MAGWIIVTQPEAVINQNRANLYPLRVSRKWRRMREIFMTKLGNQERLTELYKNSADDIAVFGAFISS